MNYLQKKKLAFMSIANRIKGFVQTVTGALPLTLTNCVDNKSIINYKLYGQCVQDGTPKPETPVEVESVGEFDESTGKYKIPIKVSGKNLFDINSIEKMYTTGGTNVSPYLSITDGILKNRYGVYANGTYIPCNIKTLSTGTYTFSCEVSGVDSSAGNIAILWNNGGKSLGFKNPDGTNWEKISLTFTLEEETTVKGVRFQGDGNKSNYLNLDIYFRNIQIEKSETATEYEPYHEPTTTNIYLDEPLRKVGDYADYIDYIRGKVVRNIFHCSLLDIVGNVTGGTMYSNTGLCQVQSDVVPSANMLIAPLSRSMKGGTKIDSYAVGLYFEDQYRQLYCYFNSNAVGLTEGMSSSEIANAIKQYIQDNEIDIYYVLKTPIEETIELPIIPTHQGANIITVDSSIQPSNAEITYYSSLKE